MCSDTVYFSDPKSVPLDAFSLLCAAEDGASARVKAVRRSLSQGEGEPGCRAM